MRFEMEDLSNLCVGILRSASLVKRVTYIVGHKYKNESNFLINSQYKVDVALSHISTDQKRLSENVYGINSGFQPRNWNQTSYVNEWTTSSRY
jgi:hypothetical protein